MTSSQDVRQQVEAIRAEVASLHSELIQNNLAVWTAGNVSGRVQGADLLVIKPSGVPYRELTPDRMVVCDLVGTAIDSEARPSSDALSHALIYRELPAVGGIVHTHSTYASAWACRNESIPCVLTAMADEFGGPIPVASFALIGTEEIGRAVVSTLKTTRSPAVLLQNHGVFAIGETPREALKAAVMCEDVARTVHVARELGRPVPIAPQDVDQLFDRYQNVYGQESE